MIRRKSNRAKRVARGCRNHGSCPWCTSGRLHSSRVREAWAIDQLREHDKVGSFTEQEDGDEKSNCVRRVSDPRRSAALPLAIQEAPLVAPEITDTDCPRSAAGHC